MNRLRHWAWGESVCLFRYDRVDGRLASIYRVVMYRDEKAHMCGRQWIPCVFRYGCRMVMTQVSGLFIVL
jgi:hypothetical protein